MYMLFLTLASGRSAETCFCPGRSQFWHQANSMTSIEPRHKGQPQGLTSDLRSTSAETHACSTVLRSAGL